MKIPKQQVVILVVLVGVMVAVYARTFRAPGPTTGPPQVVVATNAQDSGPGVATLEPSPSRVVQRQRLASLEWGRDPFTRGLLSTELSGLLLSGILWDPNEPIAIINGATVHVGEELDEYLILEIGEDHVSLTDGNQEFKLHISP